MSRTMHDHLRSTRNQQRRRNKKRQALRSAMLETLESRQLLAAVAYEDQAITILPDGLDNLPAPVAVADYRDDFQGPSPAAGWQYLWNDSGEIGDAANYSAMQYLSLIHI